MTPSSNIEHVKLERQSDGSIDISFYVQGSDGNSQHFVYMSDEDLECLLEQVQLARELCK